MLFELAEPGLPVIYVADAGVLDMRAACTPVAGPKRSS